jgi:hypothetical protein
MYPEGHLRRLKRDAAVLVLLGLFSAVSVSLSHGATTFSAEMGGDKRAAAFDFNDIWFYDANMARVIPDIVSDWLAVVFRPGLTVPERPDKWTESEALFVQRAKEILGRHNEITGYFYDHNLARDACFFKLREGLKQDLLKKLIFSLNPHAYVAYAHPMMKVGDKTYAFFNAFEMEWKTGVEQELKDRLMRDAYVAWDKAENVYRVELSHTSFFKAINLLAEDIHVLKVTPYLVEVKPSIQAEIVLPISGSNTGDEIPFLLNIAFSDLVTIDPSSIANLDLRPVDIQKELYELRFDPYDYVEAASKSPIKITGSMKFYSPGEFLIPPVKIQYSLASYADNELRSVETKALPFRVSSIVPSKQGETKLIIPVDPIHPDYKIELYREKAKSNLMLSVFSFFAALLCAALLLREISRMYRERESLRAAKEEDLLAEKLKALLMEAPAGPHVTYAAEASKLLRAYLVAKYEITEYPHGGSGQVFFESISKRLPPALTPKLGGLFKTIDDIVALELTTFPGMDSFRSQALEVIDASGP